MSDDLIYASSSYSGFHTIKSGGLCLRGENSAFFFQDLIMCSRGVQSAKLSAHRQRLIEDPMIVNLSV